MSNFPKLKGKTICLSDNSGSAWGALTTEYGSTKVAEIDNLSSVMTAINSDEGYVGIFGDRLEIEAVNKRDGVLSQLDKIQSKHSHSIGGSTENGIWLFLDEAIKKKITRDYVPEHYRSAQYMWNYDGYEIDGNNVQILETIIE